MKRERQQRLSVVHPDCAGIDIGEVPSIGWRSLRNGICQLRALVRLQQRRVEDPSRTVLHLQKALTQMNLQLTQVVSDLSGQMAIVRAIVARERDPQVLARLRERPAARR